jgi:hypothetical protein
MVQSPGTPRIPEERDMEIAAYRTVSGAAVAGLILGLLAPAALVDPVAWCLPIAGILVSAYALLRVRRNAATLAGRKAALWGLGLSLCFAAMTAADWSYYRYCVRQEARQFAAMWFELLAESRPERAFQLSIDPKHRQPLDDRLWEYYRNNAEVRRTLDRYVAPAKEGEKPPPIRTLLALGKTARVRYLDSPLQANEDGSDLVDLRYAVTFDGAGGKKTFFLIVKLLRTKSGDGRANWKIHGCVSPDSNPGES